MGAFKKEAMIKTIPGKFEKGKIIPLSKLGDTSACRIYITVIPLQKEKDMTENQFISMAKKADALYRKGKLRSVHSLKELDKWLYA